MTPRTVAEVEEYVRTHKLWRLGAASVGTCRRLVREAIEAAADPREQLRLERLLARLGE
jgi:hypothetical protein